MLKQTVFASLLLLAAIAPSSAADLAEDLGNQWAAAQTGQGNVARAVSAILIERQQMMTRLAEVEKLCGDKCKPAEQKSPAPAAPDAQK